MNIDGIMYLPFNPANMMYFYITYSIIALFFLVNLHLSLQIINRNAKLHHFIHSS